MYRIFVAFRYLLRNWLNLVGIVAVALGVLVLICVLSVMKGFDQEFRARLRATVSDLVIESWSDETFGDYESLMAKIEALPHVEACAPRFEGVGLLRIDTEGYGKIKRFGQFNGIALDREIRATDLGEYWRAWRGRTARERIVIEIGDDPDEGRFRLAKFGDDDFRGLVEGLRPEDFDRLSSAQRALVQGEAKRRGVDMQAMMAQALGANPEWGEVEDPEKYSPAFAGQELLKIGSDMQGNVVSLDLGTEMVVFAATDIDKYKIRRTRVTGQFHSGLYDYDLRNVYLPLEDVQRFMSKPGEVTSVSVRLDDFAHAEEVRAQLLGILTPEELARGARLVKPFLEPGEAAKFREFERKLDRIRAKSDEWFMEGSQLMLVETTWAELDLFTLVTKAVERNAQKDTRAVRDLREFGDMAKVRTEAPIAREFRVSTWQDKRRTFLRAVELERRIMGFILFFVILIAGFLVLAILHTTVITKTRDVGMLKSIGGTVGGIMSIFLLNGFFIGVIGSGLGTLGGVLITRNINEIEAVLHKMVGFTLFPSNIYYLDRIPTDQAPLTSTATIWITAVIVSLLASALPAWKAARMDPVEALRYE